jgi:putative transposase
MIAHSGRIVRAWLLQVASKYFARRTELPKRMPDDERFLGSVRRACLDHFLIFHEKQLSRLLQAYVVSFNQARPHQGMRQRIPDPPALSAPPPNQPSKVIAVPVLGGLHHDYQRVA